MAGEPFAIMDPTSYFYRDPLDMGSKRCGLTVARGKSGKGNLIRWRMN